MQYNEKLTELIGEISKVIVGQEDLKKEILIAILCGGHILLEGAPGLAKTKTISAFAKALKLQFKRIQFTPDLLPSDLIGAKIYDPDAKVFEVRKGPLFSNIVLADEINRAPSKVQSALLEAMQERQITIGEETYKLSEPFMVLATQNPLEQEGTFRLPEAQLDRFLLKSIVEYPTKEQELEILKTALDSDVSLIKPILQSKDIKAMKQACEIVHVSDSIYSYILSLVFATRNSGSYPEILYGASPRASLALLSSSKALAYIHGRDYVIPEDIKAVAFAVLRHRVILSYEALSQDITPDDIIKKILHNTEIV